MPARRKNPTPLQALCYAIRDGKYDDKLDGVSHYVYRELKNRRFHMSAEAAKNFRVGNTVEITGTIKPRYMMGARGKITEINGQRVWIELDEPILRTGRVRNRQINVIGVNAMSLTKVDRRRKVNAT